MSKIIDAIRQELISKADEKIKLSGERFFKEDVKMYGLKSAEVSRISKSHYNNIKDKSKTNIFYLCNELWASGIMEESFVACNWSYNVRKLYEPPDFEIFAQWVKKHVGNWASCDTLCNHTVGSFIEMYPGYLSRLKEWAKSENRWVKRASAVSLIVPAKKGKFLNEVDFIRMLAYILTKFNHS